MYFYFLECFVEKLKAPKSLEKHWQFFLGAWFFVINDDLRWFLIFRVGTPDSMVSKQCRPGDATVVDNQGPLGQSNEDTKCVARGRTCGTTKEDSHYMYHYVHAKTC